MGKVDVTTKVSGISILFLTTVFILYSCKGIFADDPCREKPKGSVVSFDDNERNLFAYKGNDTLIFTSDQGDTLTAFTSVLKNYYDADTSIDQCEHEIIDQFQTLEISLNEEKLKFSMSMKDYEIKIKDSFNSYGLVLDFLNHPTSGGPFHKYLDTITLSGRKFYSVNRWMAYDLKTPLYYSSKLGILQITQGDKIWTRY